MLHRCSVSQSARVQNCIVRETSLVNGTPRFLDPRGSKTPETIDIKFDRTSPNMQTLVFLSLRGAVVHMREIIIIRVYFYTPVTFLFLAHL